MSVCGQRHASAALPPGKTRYPLYRRLGGPQGRSGRVRKISSVPGFEPRTAQPVAGLYQTTMSLPCEFCKHHYCHGIICAMFSDLQTDGYMNCKLNLTALDLRLLLWCLCSFGAYGKWPCIVGWVVPDVSEQLSASFFRFWQTRTLSFETCGPTRPTTRRHIPEGSEACI